MRFYFALRIAFSRRYYYFSTLTIIFIPTMHLLITEALLRQQFTTILVINFSAYLLGQFTVIPKLHQLDHKFSLPSRLD